MIWTRVEQTGDNSGIVSVHGAGTRQNGEIAVNSRAGVPHCRQDDITLNVPDVTDKIGHCLDKQGHVDLPIARECTSATFVHACCDYTRQSA